MDFLCAVAPIEVRSLKGGFRMFDLLYLAVGLGFFALMGLYARFAGEA